MVRGLLLLLILTLAACSMSAERSTQIVDGQTLNVALDDTYYWPATFSLTEAEGTTQEIEVFPLVTALVVTRSDGVAMQTADEAIARTAAEAYCRGRGLSVPGSQSRLANGAWAFSPCAS